MFNEYRKHGWKLCVIPPGTKGPRTKNWNLQGAEATGPIPLAHGAGLLHAWSGTCAIDVDKYDTAREWLAERGVALDELLTAADCVQISSGRVGRAKLLYALPIPLPSLKLAPYKAPSKKDPAKIETFHALEFRCATVEGLSVQDVLPPSIHPETGNPYRWVYGDELFGLWQNLPELPNSLLGLWTAAPLTAVDQAAAAPVATKGAEYPELEQLLANQDPNASYDDWLKVGAALHHETKGSRDGLGLWDQWSQKSHKYKNLADLDTHWRSFRHDAKNPITLGTLRRDRIAALDEFEVVPASTIDIGVDTRPKSMLEQRLVYLSSQDKYYFVAGDPPIPNLDEHAEVGLSRPAVKALFTGFMKTRKNDEGKPSRPDPVKYIEGSKTATRVNALGFNPGAGRIFTEEKVRYLNQYIPVEIEALRPKAHEMEAWAFLLSRIRDKGFAAWLMKFYAHALQKPGVKIQCAPLLFSLEYGTGKSTLMKTVPTLLFGPRYVRTVSSDVINNRFTGVLAGVWWIVLDELKTSGPKTDRAATANRIKPWITEPMLEIKIEGLAPYSIPNRVQLTATSNFDDALLLDNDDRRWAIGEMMGDPFTDREKLDLYEGFLKTDRAAGVLKYLFQNEPLTGFHPTAPPPVTAAKRIMVTAGMGGWETKILEAMRANRAPFDRDLVKSGDIQESIFGGGCTQHAISRILRRPPFNCAKRHTSRGGYWCWRNALKWRRASEAEVFDHIETGSRPEYLAPWDLTPPSMIRALDDEPDDDLQDLL